MADTRAKGGADGLSKGQPGKGRIGNGRPRRGRAGFDGPDRGLDEEWDLAATVGVTSAGGASASGTVGANTVSLPASPMSGHRHDPRIDEPTKQDRRRLWKWVALMAFCPICLGVVVWAALGLNGSYPTVQPPVPAGWQSVAGIYASFSVPGSWSLKQFMSDAAGDIYYSGAGGGIGESVQQADHEPSAAGPLPVIVGTFLGWKYQVSSIAAARIPNATVAWRYSFHLDNGTSAMGVLAWVKPTQSEVWLVASRDSPTTEKAISTLTLAS